eukprot:3171979-Lingulodinium_polyedra.AAC.1
MKAITGPKPSKVDAETKLAVDFLKERLPFGAVFSIASALLGCVGPPDAADRSLLDEAFAVVEASVGNELVKLGLTHKAHAFFKVINPMTTS